MEGKPTPLIHKGLSFSSLLPDQCVHYQAALYACGDHTHMHTHTLNSVSWFSPNDV